MSDVRVSNGSPSLERMEARQAESKPSACRSLFGPVDHEQLNRELLRHRRELAEACQQKWNFDFQSHQPLAGRFEWRPVEEGASPDFYFRPPRPPKVRRGAGPEGAEDTGSLEPKTEPRRDLAERGAGRRKRRAAEGNAAPSTPGEPLPRGPPPGCPAAEDGRRDSSPQARRAKTREEEGSEESPSASSVEQTPKKASPRRCQT